MAQLFINVQLAESTLDLAQQDLKSYQNTVDISESKYKSGGISENDFLKIKLQLLQFQQDVQQAELARTQALSDLRQLLGYESVPADYEVAGAFDYQPLSFTLAGLAGEGPREPSGSARGRTRRYRGGQPIRAGQSERESGCDRFGQLFARQRHQRVHFQRAASRCRFSTAIRAKSRARITPSARRSSSRQRRAAR